MSEEPRRRSSDRDRRRWNDDRLDDLKDRTEEAHTRIGRAHDRMDGVEGRVNRLYEVLVDERDDGTAVPAASPKGGFDWKMLLAVVASIAVPIVVAIIVTNGAS